jgi:CelD/BcsL family acetyltransferase involved in cellulose biosynthesis
MRLDIVDPHWALFVDTQPAATIFQHPAWSQLLTECYGYEGFVLALCKQDHTVVAGLPIMQVGGRWGVPRLVSLPFSDYCDPLYADPCYAAPFNKALSALFQENPRRAFEVRAPLPPHAQLHCATSHVLNRLPLTSESDTLLHQACRMHRGNIRKAKRCGVTIECGTGERQLRAFYALQWQTRRYKGVPVQPLRFFELIGELLLSKGLGFILLAHHEKQCIAGALFLHHNQTLTCKYAASIRPRLKVRPNNLIFWEGIECGCRQHCQILDMGRTRIEDTGLRRFKNGWGGNEQVLTYSRFGGQPICACPPWMCACSEGAIRHSPLWVCRAAGELLYKYNA